MKISNSKKQLAKIVHENGGWRDGYDFAAQDGDDYAVWFYDGRPVPGSGRWWKACGRANRGIEGVGKLPNWHQTILSREEYFHLYPAPDAEGWIEWKGGERPVGSGVRVELQYRIGDTGATFSPEEYRWNHLGLNGDIVAYRLHKPEQAEPALEPVVEVKPTIEQLAADYRNAKDYANRKQEEADAAKADAEAKLAELVAAGKALGLVLSVAEPEPELVITDWLDLLVGDEVALTSPNGGGVNVGEVGVIRRIDGGCMSVNFPSQTGHLISRAIANWKFIRRP